MVNKTKAPSFQSAEMSSAAPPANAKNDDNVNALLAATTVAKAVFRSDVFDDTDGGSGVLCIVPGQPYADHTFCHVGHVTL